ncbi:MAG: hypothetical protein F6K48_15840 [Okeania sp. SIO3H1]|nr:hypothetical protein [Okeania sp. SIO3H1]
MPNIYRHISKIFPFLKASSFFQLRSFLPSLYKTDATGHDITKSEVRSQPTPRPSPSQEGKSEVIFVTGI